MVENYKEQWLVSSEYSNLYSFAHKSFKYGKNFKIGRFCIIEKDCEVGDNVELMDYVKLMPGTSIGNNSKLDDYVNTSGYCFIGNNVHIKRCTMIGQAVKIMDNVKVLSHVTTTRVKRPKISSKEEWIIIEEGAVIGSHSCLLAGITIGKNAIIGMGAVVVKDCEPNGVYVGNPARLVSPIEKEEIE